MRKTTHIRISKEKLQRLKRCAQKRGLPVRNILDEAIEQWLEKEETKYMDTISYFQKVYGDKQLEVPYA
jgi:predicted DNA-binding protein